MREKWKVGNGEGKRDGVGEVIVMEMRKMNEAGEAKDGWGGRYGTGDSEVEK